MDMVMDTVTPNTILIIMMSQQPKRRRIFLQKSFHTYNE